MTSCFIARDASPRKVLRLLDDDVAMDEWSSAQRIFLEQCAEECILAQAGCFGMRGVRQTQKRFSRVAKDTCYFDPSIPLMVRARLRGRRLSSCCSGCTTNTTVL